MKFAIFAFIVLFTVAACQQESVEKCVADLKSAHRLVKKIGEDTRTNNLVGLIQTVTNSEPTILRDLVDCVNVDRKLIAEYSSNSLTDTQMDCLVEIHGVLQSLNTIYQEVQLRNYAVFIQETIGLTISVDSTLKKCQDISF